MSRRVLSALLAGLLALGLTACPEEGVDEPPDPLEEDVEGDGMDEDDGM